MKTKKIGVYIHIPFCLRKCNYCDFCSYPGKSDAEKSHYVDTLCREILSYKREEKVCVDTIFFGGGTPTLLSNGDFSKIFDALKETFDISSDAEITVEANPKTVSEESASHLYTLGVNRISIGVQSIHNSELSALGRMHDFEDFVDAYKIFLSAGFKNISVDLMYGIPHQTKESFSETLSYITELSPAHVSVYGLIIEEGTPFFDNREKLPLPSENDEADMYEMAHKILSDNGYLHYEISNYAKDGFYSRHNAKYWRCEEYIGFGVAAHSYYNGVRYSNPADLSEYLSKTGAQYQSEQSKNKADDAFEYAMLGLRLSEGISLAEYESRLGASLDLDRPELKAYFDGGYIVRCEDRLSLTYKGFYISNTILTELL